MIELTTPYNPGDTDPGKSYTHAKIMRWEHDPMEGKIVLTSRLGYLDGDPAVWVPGKARMVRTEIEGENYTTEIAAIIGAPDVDALVYDKVAALLYGYLINQGVHPGTVV